MVGHSVLYVDEVGLACHGHWKERAGRVIEPEKVVVCYGYSVGEIAGRQIAKLIPKDEVAILAHMVGVHKESSRIAVISLGFDKEIGFGLIPYNLSVFEIAKGASKAKLLHRENKVNEKFLSFRVADLDGDGVRELLDVGTGGKVSVLQVRRIRSDGPVVLLQRLEASCIDIVDTEGYLGPPSILLQHKVKSANCTENLTCYSVDAFYWSASRDQFVRGE
jgi:hypothetical protein